MHNDTMNDDFDDFEDLDNDLLDDDWDAFDDDAASASDASSAPPPPTHKKASSLPRFIGFGIILLLIIGASYFFYSQFIVPAAEQQKRQDLALQSDDTDTQISNGESAPSREVYDTIEGFPPSPTPLNADQRSVEGDLIPLPDIENIAVEQLPPPSSSDISYQDNSNSYAENQGAPSVSEDSFAESDAFEDIFATVEATPTPAPAPAPQVSDVSPTDNSAFEALQAQNRDLIQKVENYEDMIGNLNEKILQLEKKSTKSTSSKKMTSKKVQPAPTQKKAVSKPKARAKVAWVLRSAQAGKAVVARKGANDIQTVEIGDRLSGIGRIQSISQTNGRWVVQGSSGKIMQ